MSVLWGVLFRVVECTDVLGLIEIEELMYTQSLPSISSRRILRIYRPRNPSIENTKRTQKSSIQTEPDRNL